MNKQARNWLTPLLLLLLVLCVGSVIIRQTTQNSSYTMEEFQQAVKDEQITEAFIQPNEEVPTGEVIIRLRDGKEEHFYALNLEEVQDILMEGESTM